MNIADIDFSEYEPEPPPANATPREYLLWATGKDYPYLKHPTEGRDFTWQELKRIDALPLITRIIQLSTKPITFVKKRKDTI